ncbi:MAG: ATP-binding protein, partial [Methanoregula sp.]|nr:ATP-binding protein [Methanoregula sp.]
ESEERYRSLYVDSREAIMIVSPERGYLAANPATTQLFSCRNEQDFIAHTPASLSPEFQPDGILSTDKFREMMHLALEKGSRFFEWTHRKMDGTDFPATVLLSRLESGGTQLLQATVRDITLQKEAEKALKVYSENLEDLVKERTKELSDAQRLATIGETATMVGHDLRNPLQVIINSIYLGNMKIAKMSPDEREVIRKYRLDDMCMTVNEQSTYMNKIVSDLQDFARPVQINRSLFPLRTFFDEIIATIDHEDTITVRVGIDQNYEITSDRNLMKRAITNLLTNAFQAIPREGMIDISARREGDYNEIEIRDSGTGMDQATLENVFQPLFTTKPKGTGLGLNVSKRLITEMGGTLEIKSRVGEGTTAVIRLPGAGM